MVINKRTWMNETQVYSYAKTKTSRNRTMKMKIKIYNSFMIYLKVLAFVLEPEIILRARPTIIYCLVLIKSNFFDTSYTHYKK